MGLLATVSAASGLDLALLGSVRFVIADLGGATLGLSAPGTILLDQTAAGYGWFIDPTPAADEEFTIAAGVGTQQALPGTVAAKHVDLLTVVMHEMGHILGLEHSGAYNGEATGYYSIMDYLNWGYNKPKQHDYNDVNALYP